MIVAGENGAGDSLRCYGAISVDELSSSPTSAYTTLTSTSSATCAFSLCNVGTGQRYAVRFFVGDSAS